MPSPNHTSGSSAKKEQIKRLPKFRIPTSKGGMLAVWAVVLVLAIGAYGLAHHANSKPKYVNPVGLKETRNQFSTPTPQTAANVAKNQEQYDTELQGISDPGQQASIYDQKASSALDIKDYTNAMTYAKKAESLAPSSDTAYLVALVAQSSGDKATAKQYLQTAISRVDKSVPTNQRIIQSYQHMLQELK